MMTLYPPKRPQLLIISNQADRLATKLYWMWMRDPSNMRLKRAYNHASARADRYLLAWRAYVALGCNDDWKVGE